LAKIAAYDPQFAVPNESMLMAWAEQVTICNSSEEDMLEAVADFYSTNTTGVKPLPASITSIARGFRRDRMAKADYRPMRDRSVDPEPPALPGVEKISMEEWEARHKERFPKLVLGILPDEPSVFDRPNPLKVRCLWCKQPKGSPCVNRSTGEPLTRSRAHDVRFAQVEGRCAHTAGWHVDPHTEGCDQA
jgi:hypothetical protein